MNYLIRFSRLAEIDILEIFDYIAKDNPKAAYDFVKEMKKDIYSLANFPYKFKEYDGSNEHFADCRVLICYPYKVFYKIGDSTVYILQIKHGARQD